MQSAGTIIGANMAACRAAAAGGFVVGAEPLGVTTVGAPAASVYLVTLAANNAIDATNCVPHCSVGTVARAITVIQASDTTFTVTGSDLAVPAAADTIFSFSAIRTAVGT